MAVLTVKTWGAVDSYADRCSGLISLGFAEHKECED